MAEIPQEWRAYASKQAELDRRSVVDSRTWGLEAGLNGLSAGLSMPETVDRTIASAARRSRYAQVLLAKYMRIDVNGDGLAELEARSAWAMLKKRMSAQHIELFRSALFERSMQGHERTALSRARAIARSIAA